MTDLITTAAEDAEKVKADALAQYAIAEGTIRTDFGTLWAHKTLVLFDLVLIAGAFVAGHYI